MTDDTTIWTLNEGGKIRIIDAPETPSEQVSTDTMNRPAFTNGVCVYDDPAHAIWVHEGEVWLSDPYYPDGERVDLVHGEWLRDFVRGMAREMARLNITVSAWPTEEVEG